MYSNLSNTKERYSFQLLVRLTNFDGQDPFEAIIDDVLTDALNDASAMIDGYLASRYSVPIATPPAYFESDCQAIAVALMIQRKGYSAGTPDESLYLAGMKVIKDRYELVASGKISIAIPGTGGDGITSAPPVNVMASYPPKIFSQETLDKY